MGLEIAINVAREETRVAVLDNGVVTDLFNDRAKHKDFVGNIYKGRVAKVLPGMQAAFIDLGLDKSAFMHASDVCTDAGPGDTLFDSEDDDQAPEMPRPKRQGVKPIEQLLVDIHRDRAGRFSGLPGEHVADLEGKQVAEGEPRLGSLKLAVGIRVVDLLVGGGQIHLVEPVPHP